MEMVCPVVDAMENKASPWFTFIPFIVLQLPEADITPV
jgi:hypothetical protein